MSNHERIVSQIGLHALDEQGADVDGQAAAYVCRDFVCQAPVKEPDKLQAQLAP